MAGILDAKTRIMDFILTDEGRRQIRDGDLRISFASFSDLGTFYSEDSGGVALDAGGRIYFEASSRHQDRIVVESQMGVITNFATSGDTGSYELGGEQISTIVDSTNINNAEPMISGSGYIEVPTTTYTGVSTYKKILTGSQVVNQSDDILLSITQNFTDNQLISKEDVFTYKQGFTLSDENIVFRPTSSRPIDMTSYVGTDGSYRPPTAASLDAIEFDQKFSHFPNFKFLPPINSKSSGKLAGKPTGVYANLNQPEILTYESLEETLKGLEKYEIRFDPTSRDNNIMIQPFEFNSDTGTVRKLTIMDFGIFPNKRGTSSGVHVFFIGKMLRSKDGSLKFANLFTLELDV